MSAILSLCQIQMQHMQALHKPQGVIWTMVELTIAVWLQPMLPNLLQQLLNHIKLDNLSGITGKSETT